MDGRSSAPPGSQPESSLLAHASLGTRAVSLRPESSRLPPRGAPPSPGSPPVPGRPLSGPSASPPCSWCTHSHWAPSNSPDLVSWVNPTWLPVSLPGKEKLLKQACKPQRGRPPVCVHVSTVWRLGFTVRVPTRGHRGRSALVVAECDLGGGNAADLALCQLLACHHLMPPALPPPPPPSLVPTGSSHCWSCGHLSCGLNPSSPHHPGCPLPCGHPSSTCLILCSQFVNSDSPLLK